MLSVSKSKSKDKRVTKEQKTPSKSSATVNGGSGLPASAYNPLLGTFHTLDTSPQSLTPTVHVNGRFHNIDDSDDHSGSTHGSGADYDSASNNDSRSVESEEQNKTTKQEAIPGADNDKREKIRQKNERKHQRQKERRAQELHERCSGYLMSRKLEALAQQLVAMGFSHERATMALILNEGRVEEAVAWLFEGGEDADKHKDQNLDTGSNLKIDISEELAQIAQLEMKLKCSKQDVERAIVACEGDMEKAEETLQSQKQDMLSAFPKPEETDEPPTISYGKIPTTFNENNVRLQLKSNSASLIPQRKGKDFNYTKTAVTLGLAPKAASKVMQAASRVQPKSEWARPQQIATTAEKRWPVVGGSSPSVSYSMASPRQVSPPQAKTESRYIPMSNEYKDIQAGSIREPVGVMQRHQIVNDKQAPVSSIGSSPTGTAAGWYPTSSEILKSNGLLTNMASSRSLGPNSLSSNQFYQQSQHQLQHHPFLQGNGPFDNNPGITRASTSWSRASTSPTLAAASSLGLFPGLSSNCASGPTSPVDWNTGGSMPSCDYTSIDWSLDRGSTFPTKHSSVWAESGTYSRNGTHLYDSGAYSLTANLAMRPSSSNGNGVPLIGLRDGRIATADSSATGSREWTSPFEGKDLFSLPRQFVYSPSL